MKKKEKGKATTAGELLKELEGDPDYQRRKREREEARTQRSRFLDRAEAPLVRELHKVGVQVESVWDLVNTREPYPKAIPVLMEHLEEGGYPPVIREGIARALAVPVLDPEDWDILLTCFREESDDQAKFALALALKANAVQDHREQLLELVRDPESGSGRTVLATALYRFRNQEVDRLLQSLVSDPEIGEGIQRLLKTGTTVVD